MHTLRVQTIIVNCFLGFAERRTRDSQSHHYFLFRSLAFGFQLLRLLSASHQSSVSRRGLTAMLVNPRRPRVSNGSLTIDLPLSIEGSLIVRRRSSNSH